MNDQLSMFEGTTCEDSPSAISSPESADGVTPCASLDGATSERSGRRVARVSRSARRANEKGSQTIAISGPSLLDSSESAVRTFSSASRFRALTVSLGSTLYAMTWKVRRTPAGRPICALRASARQEYVNVSTGQASLTGWPTPQARDVRSGETGGEPYTHNSRPLNEAVMLAGWPNPQSRDHFPAHSDAYIEVKRAQGHGMQNLNDYVMLAGWSTPKVVDSRGADYQYNRGNKENGITLQLGGQAKLAGWSTPKARDFHMEGEGEYSRSLAFVVTQVRLVDSGTGPIGFLLGPFGWEIVRASGQLDPLHSGWLMGYPVEWYEAAVEASRLLKKRKLERSRSAGSATR